MTGRVAVLTVYGTLCQRMDMMAESSGGTSCEAIGTQLDRCVADKGCQAIVLAFDSPGGSVFGVGELADKIYNARQQKRIIGIADPMAASAAYWLMAQCSELNVTPSGMVGSIGTLTAHDEPDGPARTTGRQDHAGDVGQVQGRARPIAGADRGRGAAMQDMVDSYYGQFIAAVARGRGVSDAVVRSGYGQGRVYTAKKALAAGMVDRVATMDQAPRRPGRHRFRRSRLAGPAPQARPGRPR